MNIPERIDQQTAESDRKNGRVLIAIAVVAVVIVAWTHGTFDNFLWRVHLNHSDCGQNGFGATFCGDSLKQYEQRLQQAGIRVNP